MLLSAGHRYRIARRDSVGESHTRSNLEVENNVDPDDGISWVCNACRLPIFSTPFTTVDRNLVLHNQCANDLPAKLKGHPLHPGEELILHQDSTSTATVNNNNKSCRRCRSTCGSRFYKCLDDGNCDFRLELSCALAIRILHRSHEHRLTAIRGTAFAFICAACGTQHQPLGDGGRRTTPWDLSYVCITCDFWIHPDCALLPNAIILDKSHPHPLLLTYFGRESILDVRACAICGGQSKGTGSYACFDCRYHAHINCAIYSDPHSFKPVLIRDAQVHNLLRLPMANEHTSVIMKIVSNGSTISRTHDGDDDHQSGSKLLFEDDNVHEHPLIYHDHHIDDGIDRVCNACVGLISPSDPFYSCNFNNNNNEGPCKDFFLHSCCAHLPATLITPHPNHNFEDLSLSLLSKVDTTHFNLFRCFSCSRQCNGFAWALTEYNIYLDVVCASMPTSITHDAHGKSHVLHATRDNTSNRCNCCDEDRKFDIFYECNNCHNFSLHAKCALLPDTVSHKFDRHPLKLITTTRGHDDERVLHSNQDRQLLVGGGDQEEQLMFCKICEKDIQRGLWYYGCHICDQSFHIDCIPSLDDLSKIKFGFTVRVRCHDCPVTCVRALSVDGYRCGYCEQIIRESDQIAFECSKCYFRIHENCAVEDLVSK